MMKKHPREFVSFLLTTACLWCLWRGSPFDTTLKQQNHPVVRITPTWEIEKRDLGALPPTSRPNLWSLVEDNGDRTIVLRVWYGPQHLVQSNEDGIAENEESAADTSRLLQDQQEMDDEVFAVSISFEDIYKTLIFITSAWAMGALSERLGMPSLVGEIITGFLLGPPLADFCPFPEAMVLIGNIGLIGLILESGIDIDVAQLKETGKRAVVMAFTGTSLPLLTGMGLAKLAGQDWKSAIAVGASFAPSSLGVAGNALSAGEVLNTPIGQMIVASSVVDDVLGLIQLSILEVFVKPDAQAIDFILPFISSFGYLLVLGYSGVTWMPRLIQDKLMPLVNPAYREFVAFVLMFALLLAYMPLLNYSKASYLTGTFLAGLSFSQVNSVHASFVNNGRQLLNWLLRIFFAATIGFQVPIKKFHDLYVLKWGAIFIIPVLAKIALGAYVPHFQHELPEDFPYNPYWRDVFITSLAMTCRGEFNFIIASFALGEGLFDAYLYSAVVFAVLLSSIASPLLLLKLARYYNEQSKKFLEANHDITRIGNTCDGYRPLYLAIQARTPIHWGLQETFKRALESNGLIIIDHRSWHTLGLDSVDITELFVQDTQVKVRIPSCFGDAEAGAIQTQEGKILLESDTAPEEAKIEEDTSESSKSGPTEEQEIDDRCNQVRQVLEQCLLSDNPQDYNIQVSQWKPYTFDATESGRAQYCLQSHHEFEDLDAENDAVDDVGIDDAVPTTIGGGEGRSRTNTVDSTGSGRRRRTSTMDSPVRRRSSTVDSAGRGHKRSSTTGSANGLDHVEHHEPHLDCADLWDTDNVAQEMARCGYVMAPVGHGFDVIEGEAGPESTHRRRNTYDASLLAAHTEDSLALHTIKERLHGYVRD